MVGARYWNGEYTDVPAMGMDDFIKSDDEYCSTNDKVTFKVWDNSANKLIDMVSNGDNTWQDMGISILSLTDVVMPGVFSLDRAYPNPFNPVTTLNFSLPIESEVSLSIYNLQGREVTLLVDDMMDAGYHSIVWNADHYSSGVYFVKMVAGKYLSTQKIVLVK